MGTLILVWLLPEGNLGIEMNLATLSIGTIENLLSPLPTASPNGWH